MDFGHPKILIVQSRGSGVVAGCLLSPRSWWDIRCAIGGEARKKRSVKFEFHEGLNLPVLQLRLLKGEKLTESLN